MKSSKPTRKLAAIAALLALVIAACGGGESSDTTASAPPTTEATPTTQPMAETTQPMAPLSAVNSGAACSAVPMDGEGSFDGMADDPAATAASNNPVLSTLVTAVGEAGLVDTLNGEGPFTIFAPTNDAFAAIPEDQLSAILADQEQLTSILTYHVVAGESLDMQGLVDAGTVETVNGAELTIAPSGDLIEINGTAMVVCGNVQTANATVHIIDSVLVPEAGEAMTDLTATNVGPACAAVPADGEGSFDGMADDPAATAASNNPVLSTLVTAVSEAGLVDTLNGEGPFTIFAPTNDAFAAIPEDQLNAILGDPELLTSILTFHVVAGDDADLADLIESGSVTTVQGEQLEIAPNGDLASVNGASVVCGNVQTANATVHIIDTVLVPAG